MIENPWILFAALPAAAYVIGSTPVGVIIAHFHNVDLRSQGSGNVGATNVGRVIGRKWGFLCFYLDVAKGLIPALVASMLVRGDSAALPTAVQQASMLTVAFGAIAGHVFSFWLKFTGGKGVATSLGVVLGVFPYFTYPGLCAFAIWIAVTLTSRYVSLGSIVAAAAFVALFAAFNFADLAALWPLGTFAATMASLIIIRHRTNITRLLAGTESKIGAKRAESKRG
ncbi:MAG: glycerol-3-phosphate 1-O-acyltransferase PlsY [Phycisphaerae bacterium]|nr:glycerol-3-phosphate 1-O-acyltransferase PlsY [Phycisphaerae bacterium]